MTPDKDLSPEQIKAIATVEKLLRLAAKNPNENERASAEAKAFEIMKDMNLDMATVEENSGESGKRADEKLKGGHYKYQRDLWRHVAELNFCLYFSVTEVNRVRTGMRLKDPAQPWKGYQPVFKEVRTRQHRIVGRTVNTRATKVMAEYLEQTVQRLTEERLHERYADTLVLERSQLYGTWANSYREGMVERICEKIYDRRRHLMREERRKAQEAAQKAREQGFEGTSTATAITLSSVTKSEHDANMEFLQPGYIAREAKWDAQIAAERAARAERLAAAEAEYAAWAAANPEEARKAEERAQKEARAQAARELRNARRRVGREYREPAYKGDWGARRAGYEAGDSVSIDLQAGTSKPAGMIG